MRYRKTLFAGVTLAVTGAVLLLAGNDPAVRDVIADAVRLWPVALIAFGVVLLARRTRFALPATLGAAIMAGLLVGGVVVATPDLKAPCPQDGAAATETRQGVFEGSASVDLHFSCGDLEISTVSGAGWQLGSLPLGEDRAIVTQDGDRLRIRSAHRSWAFGRRSSGDAWRVALPTGVPLDLDAEINAAHARLDLAGLRLGRLDLRVNAADLSLDLEQTDITALDLELHAGHAAVTLPAASDLTGAIRTSAGKVEVCVPAGLGVTVTSDVALGDADYQGLIRVGETWQTPNLASATHVADLSIDAAAASVVIDPEGGCK